MCPVIRIDDDVWGWLQSLGRPFEDTPNSVLRRVAGLDTTSIDVNTKPVVARQGAPGRGGRTMPQSDFRDPILRILARHRGTAERGQVLKELERDLGERLSEFDRKDIRSGTIRWQKSAEWEVSVMRKEGLLKTQDDSQRGEWSLSATGEEIARRL